MILTDDRAIERVALGMIERTLPKCEWTHEAHFAAALWLLRMRPAFAEPDEIRILITRYNEATGTPNTEDGGYHHSITLASMRGAAAYLAAHPPGAPLHTVLAALMAGPMGKSDWLLAHWRRETLFDAVARREWVEPDRAPLPF